MNVRGIPLRLVDTAGIRETEDVVERIGVERSRRALEQADLVLLLLNYGEPLTEDDRRLLEIVRGSYGDHRGEQDGFGAADRSGGSAPRDRRCSPGSPVLEEERGLDRLEEAIDKLFLAGKVEGTDATYVSNVRHVHLLEQALGNVREAIEGLRREFPSTW